MDGMYLPNCCISIGSGQEVARARKTGEFETLACTSIVTVLAGKHRLRHVAALGLFHHHASFFLLLCRYVYFLGLRKRCGIF